MKMLKKYAYLLTVVAVAFGFAACSDSDDYAPGEVAEGPQVYFAQNTQTEFILSSAAEKVQVRVLRADATEACSIPVVMTAAEESYGDLFSIPAYVDFAAGQKEATLNVDFDLATLTEGATYELALTLDDPTMTTPYGMSEVTLTVKVPEPYVLLGTGLIRDDIFASLFTSVVSVEWEVEIYENTNQPGYIFLKNAYTSLYPYNEPGDYVEEDKYFVVKIADPDKVVIPVQGLGVDWYPGVYGDVIVGTAAYGTLKNGVITFPVEGLLIALEIYSGGEWMLYGNASGLFRIALPGAVLTDFSLEVAANGHVADKSGQAMPVVNVVGGADVAAVGVKFVAGDVTADYAAVVEEIVAKPTLTNLVEGACTVTGTEPMEAGQVTAVVVPYDANGVAQVESAVAVAFYFAGCGAELPACELVAYLFPYTQFWEANDTYNNTNTVAIGVVGTEIENCSFALWDTASFDMYQAQGYGLEAFVDPDPNGEDALPAEYIDGYVNDGGLVLRFSGLPSGMELIVVAYGKNIYGSETYVTSNRLSTEAVEEAVASAKASFNGQGMLKSMQRVPLTMTWSKREIK